MTVTPVAEAPVVTVPGPVTVNEGATVALAITDIAADADDTLGSVTISGVASDATLSAGTNNHNGSWTLTAGQLAGLTVTAGETSMVLSVTAASSEGSSTAASAAQTIAVTVTPVAEAPVVTVPGPVTVNEGATVALAITDIAADADDTLGSVTISGVASDATLSAGTNNHNGSWTLTAGQLAGLTVTAGETSMVLSVTAASSEEPDGGLGGQTIAVTVTPVAEAPVVTVPGPVTVNEGATVALAITDIAADADDTLGSVTISGVASDATLSAGTNNHNGSWTLTAGQLAGLTVTAGETSMVLSVTAASSEGSSTAASAAQTIAVTVTPVAEAPAA